MNEVVLRTHALVKRFGGITATDHVSLTVTRGARHALIGPNGAGKTTLINQLTGVLAPTSGRVELQGRDITRLAPHKRVGLGLVRTFQMEWPVRIPGDEEGEVEYSITRAEWEATRPEN
jgi:branched-chain amino acid transport system ATP-binding protein